MENIRNDETWKFLSAKLRVLENQYIREKVILIEDYIQEHNFGLARKEYKKIEDKFGDTAAVCVKNTIKQSIAESEAKYYRNKFENKINKIIQEINNGQPLEVVKKMLFLLFRSKYARTENGIIRIQRFIEELKRIGIAVDNIHPQTVNLKQIEKAKEYLRIAARRVSISHIKPARAFMQKARACWPGVVNTDEWSKTEKMVNRETRREIEAGIANIKKNIKSGHLAGAEKILYSLCKMQDFFLSVQHKRVEGYIFRFREQKNNKTLRTQVETVRKQLVKNQHKTIIESLKTLTKTPGFIGSNHHKQLFELIETNGLNERVHIQPYTERIEKQAKLDLNKRIEEDFINSIYRIMENAINLKSFGTVIRWIEALGQQYPSQINSKEYKQIITTLELAVGTEPGLL